MDLFAFFRGPLWFWYEGPTPKKERDFQEHGSIVDEKLAALEFLRAIEQPAGL